MAPIIIHGPRLFSFYKYIVHNIFNMTCATHCGTTASLYQVSCLDMLPSVSYACSSREEDEQFTKQTFVNLTSFSCIKI